MKKFALLITVFLFSLSCKERYEVSLPADQTGYLVVEGFINSSGKTEIRLSTATLLDVKNIQFEKEASVLIEADNNVQFPLIEQDSGKYVSAELQLDGSQKYRVNIRTAGGKQYVSSFESPIETPEIDSISWTRYNQGVEIYVNSRDPESKTQYYRWQFDETWQFTSKYQAYLYIDFNTSTGTIVPSYHFYDTVGQKPADSLRYCWQSRSSSKLEIGSTEKLGESRVYQPLVYIPKSSWELSERYSIIVRQFGLTKEGYEFYSKLKKNTESVGSIFDAQPSEIRGNLYNINDEKEFVIGYVGVSSVTEKRIFITNSQVPDWNYQRFCAPEHEVPLIQDSILYYFYYGTLEPTVPIFNNDGFLVGVAGAEPFCVDCRLRGTNKKPSFWP